MIGADEMVISTHHGSTISIHRNRQSRDDMVRDLKACGYVVEGDTVTTDDRPQDVRNAVVRYREKWRGGKVGL